MMLISSNSVIKKLLVLFLAIICFYFAKGFLVPLSIASVIATLFLPLCNWLEQKNISRGLASLVCLLTLLLAFSSIALLLGWQVTALTNDLALLKLRILETSLNIQEYISSNFGITLEKQSQLLKEQRSSYTWIIPTMAGSLASVFVNFFLSLVYIFCFLYYRGHLKIFLLKLTPVDQQAEMEKVIYRVAQVSQQYLLGLSKMIVCLWIMYGIGFSIIGVKNALFFAVLCGLLEIVPFIGNITGTTITLLVAAVQGASAPMLFAIVGTYGVVQLIQGWILEPIIVGAQVKINPLFTIIALVIGELVWGIPGIFLAIPLMAMFKIICDHIEPLKPYGYLIGEVESAKDEPGFIKKIVRWSRK